MALVGMVKSKVMQGAADAAAQVNTSWFKLDHVLPTLRSGFWSASDSVSALLRACADGVQGAIQTATKKVSRAEEDDKDGDKDKDNN